MEIQESAPHGNRKAIVLLAVLAIVTLVGAFLPASWFGMKSGADASSLTSVTSLDLTPRDEETGEPYTWKRIAENAFSDNPAALEELAHAPVDKDAIALLNDENNLTASFSKDLFLASSYLKDHNILDEETHAGVVGQLFEQAASTIVPTVYTAADLNIASSETKASIKAYGNSLAASLSGILTVDNFNADITAVYDYITTQNPDVVAPLKKNLERVEGSLGKLRTMPVPPSAVVYHLSAINTLARYRDTLYNMSKVATDPLRANVALSSYTEMLQPLAGIHKDLAGYFNVKNVAFTSKEPGYVFVVGYTIK